jgi:Na+-transporting methylmalonyl-CoA/oxaloacetate decarboxylase gamma subunit
MTSAPAVPPLLLALSQHPTFWEDVRYQSVGVVVVFSALVTLWLALEAIGSFFRRNGERFSPVAPKPAAPAVANAARAVEPPLAEGPIPAATLAVIAAAVHATAGPGHRIVAIAPVSASNLAWGAEGRREHAGSHRIR